MRSRILRGRVAFWSLAAVAWLVSHDAVFFAQLGPGAPLTRTLREAAHDYWGTLGLLLVALAVAAAVAFGLRLRRLRDRARSLGARPAATTRRAYLRRAASAWVALLAIVAIAFLVQENVEHLRTHGHLIGTGALLGPEYPLAIPVIGLITLGAALIGAALSGVERSLIEAIGAVIARLSRRPPVRLARAPLRFGSPVLSPLAGVSAGRAPPLGFASIP